MKLLNENIVKSSALISCQCNRFACVMNNNEEKLNKKAFFN